MPRPCSPILASFPGFAHVLLTYPERLMNTSWKASLVSWRDGTFDGDCRGYSTRLHTSCSNRNSGCNSTASCKNTRLFCGDRLLYLLGQGNMCPRMQPRRHLVSLFPWDLYLCRRIGSRHWCVDTTLRTHFIVVDDIYCRLSTHVVTDVPKVSYHNSICFVSSHHHCYPMLRATCKLLKYYNKFASRVRSLGPHNTSRGSSLNLPASSCFILCLSPLHSVFAVEQLLLAHWLHVRCFLSLPLTLPTQCVRLP